MSYLPTKDSHKMLLMDKESFNEKKVRHLQVTNIDDSFINNENQDQEENNSNSRYELLISYELPKYASKDKFKLFSFKIGIQFENITYLNCKNAYYMTTEILKQFKNIIKLNCINCHNITEISGLDKLKILNCSSCRSLKLLTGKELKILKCQNLKWITFEILSQFINLEELDCSWCEEVKKISGFNKLKILNCSNCKGLELLTELKELVILKCENIKYITDEILSQFINLKELDCSRCLGVKKIENFNQLENLTCCYNEELTSLLNIENLITLDCHSTGITTISLKLINIKAINCDFCSSLKTIENYSTLEKLSCSSCNELKILPNGKNLKDLHCCYCKKLKIIPEYENLENLDCNNCEELKAIMPSKKLIKINCSGPNELQYLSGFTNLEILICKDNVNLESINNMNKLILLDCEKCDKIVSLLGFNNLIILDCQDCKGLKTINGMNSLMNLKIIGSKISLPRLNKLVSLECEYDSFKECKYTFYNLLYCKFATNKSHNLLQMPKYYKSIYIKYENKFYRQYYKKKRINAQFEINKLIKKKIKLINSNNDKLTNIKLYLPYIMKI